jgi:hypothetical protein
MAVLVLLLVLRCSFYALSTFAELDEHENGHAPYDAVLDGFSSNWDDSLGSEYLHFSPE